MRPFRCICHGFEETPDQQAAINAVLEEGGKFASQVIAPLNQSGDAEGCVLDKATHEVRTPKGFKEAYAKYV